jgi:acylpyruvate hydrolase
MRLVTIRTAGGTRAARVDGDQVVELDAPDVATVLDAGIQAVAEAPGAAPGLLAEVDLAPVVPRPSKIICLGLNYKSHIEEMQGELPSHPTLFAKFASSLAGPRDPLPIPSASNAVDWEAELGIVIGRRIRNASPTDAVGAIGGYTIVNDISMRDWQWRTSEWLQGKTWERCTPVGPAVVTPDEVDDAADLLLRCEVDGEVVQEARTSDLLFKPAQIVEYVSQICTLEPGDLISTGTPAGVGAGRQPPKFLEPGNIVRTSIEGLGELVNECVQGE